MTYLTTIGLEVHVQLRTRSKMFCGCSTRYGAPPNTQVCPVCLGYPGAMPVMNGEAVRFTVLTGLMLGCDISPCSKFDRKSYFYPDMPKNYQISQYDRPLCLGGTVAFALDGQARTVRLRRIHLEEDVGKNIHFAACSGVDFNRAGVPLMEIVTEPDIGSAEEAYGFLSALKRILLYAGVSDCNLEEGNLRCDVNCSVRPAGQSTLGTKTEIKNLNTFKGVLHALKHEVARQVEVLSAGGTIEQDTRRWDVDAGVTASMRSKEDAHDYRYFPEPDLMPVVLSAAQIEAWRATLPEMPEARRRRFVEEYPLPEYDAGVLVADKDVADFFEATVSRGAAPKAVSNWMMTEVLRLLTAQEKRLAQTALTPQALASLVSLVERKVINTTTAKGIFAILFVQGGDPEALVKAGGLAQVSDAEAIEGFVAQAMAENPKSVADYRAGKAAAAKFLVGQVMRLSRGKANPQIAGQIMDRKLRGDSDA